MRAFAGLLSGVLLLPACAVAQETAGRILVAVGEVTLVRGAQRLPAKAGMEVRSGDALELGTQSNAQMRLSDASVVALRPETHLRIAEYAFQGRAEADQRGFFELVRGGMRTVTGAIGRVSQRNYAFRTPTATIGIRGTNYALVHCDGGCRNRDGSLAPNGTYGSVTDGRIAVSNQAGESVFGSDQYFRVPSPAAAPERLIGPPPFLPDRLEGRQRARQQAQSQAPGTAQQQAQQAQQQAEQASAGAPVPVATTGASGGTGDTRVSGTTTTTVTTQVVNTIALQATTEASTTGPATLVQSTTGGGTLVFRAGSGTPVTVTACASPPCGTVQLGEVLLGVNLTSQRASVRTSFNVFKSNGTFEGAMNLSVPTKSGVDGIPVTIKDGQVTFVATANRSDFPNNQLAFRCQACGPGNTVGFVDSITVSGTISGSSASFSISVVDAGGGGTATTTLSQITPAETAAAAVLPNHSGGANAVSSAATLNPSGQLIRIGPAVGFLIGNVNTANNTTSGTAASAGNLAWGMWSSTATGRALVTDVNYNSALTTSAVPWIVGDFTQNLPPSLGTLTYSPVGSIVNGGSGVLNSASLKADFVNRSLDLSLNARNVSANATFQMNGTTGFSSVNGRFSSGFQTVTCTGSCSAGTPSGSFSGFFAGPNAEGAGVAFSAGFGIGTGVSGVAAMKR